MRLQRFGHGLALLAIVLASLLPTVSRGLAAQASPQQAWDALCSAVDNARESAESNPGVSDDAPSTPALEACAYCLLLQDRLVVPLAASAVPRPLGEGLRFAPEVFASFSRPDLRLAESRGPPGLQVSFLPLSL